MADLLTGGSEEAGEVVDTVKAEKEYPRTKVGFCDWGKDKHGISPSDIGGMFQDAIVEFDTSKWDELKEVIEEAMAAQPA